MKPKYAIYLIPELKDRKKISNLRSKMCKLCHTTQSLQYPVHISLASGTIIKDYSKFEKELKEFCKKQKPFTLLASKNTTVLTDRFWIGISIKNTKNLQAFKNKVESIKNKNSVKARKMYFVPHITLAFPAKVDDIKPLKNPVAKLTFNRITIARKEKEGEPYRVYKHYNLK